MMHNSWTTGKIGLFAFPGPGYYTPFALPTFSLLDNGVSQVIWPC